MKLRSLIVLENGKNILTVFCEMFNGNYAIGLEQRFSNFFQVGTTFISQNVLRTTLHLGLSDSLGLP